jgi:hypothetical protein
MIFGVLVIILVAVIAYFHYVQGLLSGVLSATCAAVAAVLAFSYHEQIAQMLLGGKLADQAHAMILVALFAFIYLILRVIFDNLVPGNVRMPAIVDKVGGAITGLIAGIFAIGILAIATETLPFGPSIGGYARYGLAEQNEVKLPTSGQAQDTYVYNELKNDKITPEDASRLIIPVDDMVVNFVSKLSNGGSLEGDRTLDSVHPNYLDEAFFNRLGMQVGAKHVAVNTDKQQQVKVEGLFAFDALPQVEAEIPQVRPPRKDLKALASNPGNQILVVRVVFSDQASDDDHMVRVSPASVRLVANGVNYIPLGTIENSVIASNKPDDFLIVEANKPVDFVFYVPRADVLTGRGAKPARKPGAATAESEAEAAKVNPGVFIEVKRMARTDLSGKEVSNTFQVPESQGVLRKKGIEFTPPELKQSAPKPGGTNQ